MKGRRQGTKWGVNYLTRHEMRQHEENRKSRVEISHHKYHHSRNLLSPWNCERSKEASDWKEEVEVEGKGRGGGGLAKKRERFLAMSLVLL